MLIIVEEVVGGEQAVVAGHLEAVAGEAASANSGSLEQTPTISKWVHQQVLPLAFMPLKLSGTTIKALMDMVL